MVGDESQFDCRACCAVPQLQERLGCFNEIDEPLATFDGFDFHRCPITYRVEGARRLLGLERSGALANASFETKNAMPAKRMAGLLHLQYLRQLKEAS